MQTSGTATLVKSAASVANVEAVRHGHPHSNGSLMMMDRKGFVRCSSWSTYVLLPVFICGAAFISGGSIQQTDALFVDRLWTDYYARALCIRSPLHSNCCGVLTLPSSPLSSSLQSPLYVVLRLDISVDVLSRDVLTPAPTCIGIRSRVPVGVRACLGRTFELCERLRGMRSCFKLSTPVYAHLSLNIVENYM